MSEMVERVAHQSDALLTRCQFCHRGWRESMQEESCDNVPPFIRRGKEMLNIDAKNPYAITLFTIGQK